jgi:poly(3-hydroxybutyrate) depolymerase
MRLRARLLLLPLAALALACALAGSATARPHGEIISAADLGDGAGEVWVFRPGRPPHSIVVFLHGAESVDPLRYSGWLQNLAGTGSAVIFPRYQVAAGSSPTAATLQGVRAGLSAGFAYLRTIKYGLYEESGKPVPVVVAGFASGGSLAFYYAANARRWGMPAPLAVHSIFPTGRIPGVPLGPIAPTTKVLIQVGDKDPAGIAGGADLWRWLAPHPAAHKRLLTLRSSPGLPLRHFAPLATTAAAETVFWTPLIAFIDAARGA